MTAGVVVRVQYAKVPDLLITIQVPSSRIRSLSWYATVREGISGDVSWYPKVRGGTRRHRVDACAVLLMDLRTSSVYLKLAPFISKTTQVSTQ